MQTKSDANIIFAICIRLLC